MKPIFWINNNSRFGNTILNTYLAEKKITAEAFMKKLHVYKKISKYLKEGFVL